jgi:predicted ATPase
VLAGENGSGKSTLVEAIAVAAGFNPEGGSLNSQFETRASHSSLHEHLTLERGARRPRTGFFLRAESLFNVASYVDTLGPEIQAAYGGGSLHERSHGESFITLAVERFGSEGLYLLDEPESALSVRGCLALLARMDELVAEGSQFVVATHSPLLAAFPGARIYELSDNGITTVEWEELEDVRLTRSFLDDPERFFHHLLGRQ